METSKQRTTVKSLNAREGRIGGYLVVWGDSTKRDLQGEYFTPESDLALEWYRARPVLYHHGLDGQIKSAVIGTIDRLEADAIGVWAEAQLDLHQRYVRAVQRLIEKGVLHWSGGSLAHLVEVGADGHIKRWPLVEGSLTPTPAEPRRTDVQTIKSAYEALGLTIPPCPVFSHEEAESGVTKTINQLGENDMQIVPTNEETPTRQLPVASQQEALKRISVSSAYDPLDTADMLHGYMLMRAAKGFHGVSEHYANALAHKVQKSGLVAAIKADELSYTTQTGFGDEWVPELWSAQIWNKARQDNVILPLFQSIEMPSNPFDLPIEGGHTPKRKNSSIQVLIGGSARYKGVMKVAHAILTIARDTTEETRFKYRLEVSK